MRQMTQHGIKKLIEYEGSRTEAYTDSAGFLTIGVGHLLTKDELRSGKIEIDGLRLPWRFGISELEVEHLLSQDIKPRERAVEQMVTVALTPGQFDCLVSFVFNVGRGAFAKSTLLKKLNKGDYDSVPDELRKWKWSAGKPVLVTRREKEINDLWFRENG